MKYALDAEHNLVPGDDLTFAYQGSGVATFTDAAGTGFRIPIGARNLAGVSADGKVHLETYPVEVANPTPVGGYEDLFTAKQLKALCIEREIELPKKLNKTIMADLLVEWDQTHPVEVEDAD
jgi:hypothetical protein